MEEAAARRVTIRYFDGCPHWREAVDVVRAALREVGSTEDPAHELVTTPEDAELLGFVGSPTILVDGVDVFASPHLPFGLACRIYQTPEGLAGVPSREQLIEALRAESERV